jgi:hypothetical protein
MDIQRFRSIELPWSDSGSLNFPIQFLEPARRMISPEVERLKLRMKARLTVANGTVLEGATLCQLFSDVQFKDAAGDRVKLHASSLRIVNWLEKGAAFRDPLDLTAGANQDVVFELEIPLAPLRARRRADFRVAIDEILDGGELNLFCKAGATLPTDGADAVVVSATAQWYARLVEGHKREGKSRMTWLEYNLSQLEYTYPAQGWVRYLAAYVGQAGERAGHRIAAQNITSRTLDITNIPDDILRSEYLAEMPYMGGDSAGVTAVEDPVAKGAVVPLHYPQLDQKQLQNPDCQTVHVQFLTSIPDPADQPKMLVCSVTDRSTSLFQRVAKADSPNKLAAAIDNIGYVKGADGGHEPPDAFTATALRRLPMKFADPRTARGQSIIRSLRERSPRPAR